MTTPRGGQYQLTLPDGTQVWLNAASSITYPTTFIEKNRTVKITGEVYFEVKKNSAKPFRVETRKDKIEVLGTNFNVNSYSEESIIKTSLLQGSVRINEKILKPGEAYLNGNIVKTNIEQDIAWKNGVFDFRNMSVEAALKQLARWYDVDIVYDGPRPTLTLGGEMNRELTLKQVLKGLGGMAARFRLEGRVLHVTAL